MRQKNTKNLIKLIFFACVFLLSIFFYSNESMAAIATGTSGDCTYTITELSDGTYSVTISGEGAMADYTYTYSSSGWYSTSPLYNYRSYISEVYIEEGVTSIGNCTFYKCTSLTDLGLSSCTSLESIGEDAFYYCSSLTELDLSNCTSLTSIDSDAFFGCTGVTAISLKNCTSLEDLDTQFGSCSAVVTVDLSGCTSLTSLGTSTKTANSMLTNRKLTDCVADSLVEVDLSDCSSLKTIGYGYFRSMHALESINLSGCVSLEEIDGNAFAYCTSLKNIDLSDCTQLTSVGDYAFYDCISLENIDLSNCPLLTEIGYSAFCYCYDLQGIVLSSPIDTIENYTFYYCSSLTEINLSSCTSLTSIGSYAFYHCDNLTDVKFPSSLETTGDYAFYCTQLEEIDLSNCSDLSYIGIDAFYRQYDNYSENINIYLPKNTIVEIGEGGLYGVCMSESWNYFYSGYYYIDDLGIAYYYDEDGANMAFVPCGISNMEIPSSITVDEIEYGVIGIYNFAFSYASDLEEITFEDSSIITCLEAYSFAYCENLTTVGGYSTSDEIMENVFYNVSLDDADRLFEYTNIDTTFRIYYKITWDCYEYFTYETEIDEPSEVAVQLYCDGEVIEEVTLSKDEIDGSIYTFEDLEVGHEYYVDVKHNLDGWGANIRYYYAGDSTLTYEYINIERIYAYTVDIEWNDGGSTGERPSEVEVILYDENGNEYATAFLNEENNWSYTFYVNTFSSVYMMRYNYKTVEYTASVVAEDSIIEADIVFYEVIYEDSMEVSIVTSTDVYGCYVSNDSTADYYPGATISLTYTEMAPTLESEIEKNGTEEITEEDLIDLVGTYGTFFGSYEIHYVAMISDYKGDVTLILTDTLPYAIDEEQSDLDGGTYNSEDKTITWEEDIDTINTYSTDEEYEIEITKSITVVYTDIDLTEESFTNDVEATIELLALSSSETATWTETVQDDAETQINITTEITVEKEWNDSDNQDGKRPESIEVQLCADVVTMGNSTSLGTDYLITLNDENNWTYTWSNLDVYGDVNGYEGRLVYTVQEVTDLSELGYIAEISGSASEGYTITNSYEPETRNISVTKVWEDSDNQDGKRLESVDVQLYEDGESLGEDYLVTLSEENNWTYTWEDLDTYKDGEEIAYTVQEVTDLTELGYIAEITGNASEGYIITNSYEPETRSISVTKVWEDSDNQDGKRPESIEVQLYADGESLGEEYLITLSDTNSWTYTWKDLDTYKDGEEIAYTVKEITDFTELGYIAEITGNASEGYIITNSYEPETRSISVTKVWEDSDNQDGKRPESIEVQLYADGESLGEEYLITLSDTNSWTYTWENLDTYKNGKEITYTVQEVTDLSNLGYDDPVITGSASEGYTITNSVSTVSITITKISSTDSSVLEGVKFSLYRQVCSDDHDSDLIDANDCDATCWELFGTYTTGEDGTFTLSNLPITGIYRLVETKTIEDYVLPSGQWKIEFEYDDNLTGTTYTVNGVELQVTGINNPPAISLIDDTLYLYNNTAYDLPTTGAIGINSFIQIGTIIILIGIILKLLKKRKKVTQTKFGSLRESVNNARRITNNWDKRK